MIIGLVVHGPEVIDSGMTLKILDYLQDLGQVHAELGGTMGAIAVIDAGLGDRIKIKPGQLVSNAIQELDQTCDVIILLNSAKSRCSGAAFGNEIISKIPLLAHPLIQVDNGFYIVWNGIADKLTCDLVSMLGLEMIPPSKNDVRTDDPNIRTIAGVSPGENVWVNGSVIGIATSEKPKIIKRDGKIELEGIEPKDHGLHHLGTNIDLSKATVRSGSIRRTESIPRILSFHDGERLILVDHDAEGVISKVAGTRMAVTIGDDTTRIAMSVLARYGIPAVGVIDGDEDGICNDHAFAPDSLLIRVKSGTDDIVGASIRRIIFHGMSDIKWSYDTISLAKRIMRIGEDLIVEIVILSDPSRAY